MFRRTLSLLIFAVAPIALAHTTEHTLPNGMKIIVKEDHRAPVVMTQIWYKIGSVDEVAGKTGLSHALEHMMFKGTPTVAAGEYSRQISALGGQENAYTTTEETVYHVNIAAQHLPKILALEADRMANLNFSDDVFANEMKVIKEERRERIEDNPSGLLYETLLQNAWTKSPNQTSVIGTMNDLNHLQANDLRRWYQQWYAPNNATLIVVGDVNAQIVFDQATQYFGKIAAKKLPERQNISEPQQRTAIHTTVYGNTKQPMMLLAYRVPHLQKINERLPYALDMLTNILDGHSAARLSKNLVRGKQIAQSVDTSYSLLARQPQMWIISATPATGISLTQLQREIKAQIADIAENGISQDELNRAKTIEKARAIFAKDSIGARASLMGSLHISGFSWRDEDEIRQRINDVTPKDIQAAAQLLTPSREVSVQMLPNRTNPE